MFVSYSQNFEDVLLWRALKHIEGGFYIDIGAHDPVADSVSLAFYERGWRGVHVEPTPVGAAKLREARRDEEVIEAAIGLHEGPITFFDVPETGLSTGDEAVAAKYKADGLKVEEIQVAALPLSRLLDQHSNRDIHWLKIDVEGMEDEVIESWPPSLVRPWVVVIESTVPRSQEPNYSRWEPKLLLLGYEFAHDDGLNRFYVHRSKHSLKASFKLGPNFFDDFSVAGQSPYARKLNGDIARLHQELSSKAVELDQLAHSREALQAEAEAQRAAFTHATQAWETASAALIGEITQKNERLAAHEAEIGRLHHHIAGMNGVVSGNTSEIARLNQQMAEAEAESVRAKEALEAQIADKEKAVSAREAEIASLRQKVAELGTANARARMSLPKQIADKDAEILARDAKISRLNAQIANLKTGALVKDQLAAAHAAVVEQLNRRLSEMEASSSQLQTSHARQIELFEKSVAEREQEIARLNRRISQSSLALDDMIKEKDQAIAALEAQVVRLGEYTAELDQRLADVRQQEASLKQQLSAVHSSTSWRITGPLRAVVNALRAVARWPKAIARWVLERALRFVAHRPRVRRLFRGTLHFVPPVERRLERFAQQRGFGSPTAAEFEWSLEPEPEALKEWQRLLNVSSRNKP